MPAELREGPHVIGWALGVAASTVHAVRRHGCPRLVTKPITDHSRLGFATDYLDETSDSALAFLAELVRFHGQHGIRVEPVLTDNGACSKRRRVDACAAHGIAVKKTRAYRPQTNGQAERFIRTLPKRWAYAYSYQQAFERLAALSPALDFCNRFHLHSAT